MARPSSRFFLLLAALLLLATFQPLELEASDLAVVGAERVTLPGVTSVSLVALSTKFQCRDTDRVSGAAISYATATEKCQNGCLTMKSILPVRAGAPYGVGCCMGSDANAKYGYCHCCKTGTTCPSTDGSGNCDTTKTDCVVMALAGVPCGSEYLPTSRAQNPFLL